MTFPLEQAHLLTHLRVSFGVLTPDDEYSKSIVKPLEVHDRELHAHIASLYPKQKLLLSPPIGFDVASELRRLPTKSLFKSIREELEPKSPELIANSTISLPEEAISPTLDSILDSGSSVDGTPKPAVRKKKNAIAKLFHPQQKSLSSDSDTDSDSNSDSNESIKTHIITQNAEKDDADVVTLDSDFGVPVTETGEVIKKQPTDVDTSEADYVYEEEDTRYTDDEDDDEDEYDETFSSSDLAFTDIETDSVLDSSSILDSFSDDFTKKLRRKKLKNSFAPSFLKNSSKSLLSSSNYAKSRTDKPVSNRSFVISQKKSLLKFEKQEVTTDKSLGSNLSLMIQSRFNSANINPLQYYLFVGSNVELNSQKAKINFFVPPSTSPTITGLLFDDNVSVADCIGFVLLSLSKLDEFNYITSSVYFMNPNHWRLELVDEDGENFGSFGILDRSRLLSSYNNPRDLAICRVENATEIAKNNLQSPLPQEFRASLDQFEQKKQKGEQVESIDVVSLKITCSFFTPPVAQFDVSSNSTLEEVLINFCTKHNLDPDRYRFKLQDEDLSPALLVSQLPTLELELAPSTAMQRISLGQDSFLDSVITPSDNTFGVSGISPVKKRLSNLSPESTVKEEKVGRRNTADAIRKQLTSNKYLEDIISGKNDQIPTTLNEIYLKWRVWRKKPTILNKIEKTLIVDGDYIHLTPAEDTVWKKTPLDSPFLSSNQDVGTHHHHHYLQQYNYSNYYNKLMMKTSSFHITQITKLKQYTLSKNPSHFKIVIKKDVGSSKDAVVKKKYDLEAVNATECEEIVSKIRYVLQVYNMGNS